jgi:hypothetical protein
MTTAVHAPLRRALFVSSEFAAAESHSICVAFLIWGANRLVRRA